MDGATASAPAGRTLQAPQVADVAGQGHNEADLKLKQDQSAKGVSRRVRCLSYLGSSLARLYIVSPTRDCLGRRWKAVAIQEKPH